MMEAKGIMIMGGDFSYESEDTKSKIKHKLEKAAALLKSA